jgi:heme/copper-type cytochrome/quinol oxidase subunit 2
MLREVLRAGIERGDVRPDLDPSTAIDVLKAAYAWNYRMAACRQASATELSAMMDRQIQFIAQGWRVV